jgi:exodeoxyribonuclease VII small subunit
MSVPPPSTDTNRCATRGDALKRRIENAPSLRTVWQIRSIMPSKPSRSTAQPSPDSDPAIDFEAAMRRLEQIVEAMESGDTPLAELLARYEEGTRLLAHCEARLKAAELKIEQLKVRRDGGAELEAFALSARPDAP